MQERVWNRGQMGGSGRAQSETEAASGHLSQPRGIQETSGPTECTSEVCSEDLGEPQNTSGCFRTPQEHLRTPQDTQKYFADVEIVYFA